MSSVLENGKESLLGQRDGEALGIIKIDLEGEHHRGPRNQNKVSRLETLHRTPENAATRKPKQQKLTDLRMQQLVDKYRQMIKGIQ